MLHLVDCLVESTVRKFNGIIFRSIPAYFGAFGDDQAMDTLHRAIWDRPLDRFGIFDSLAVSARAVVNIGVRHRYRCFTLFWYSVHGIPGLPVNDDDGRPNGREPHPVSRLADYERFQRNEVG